MITDQQEKRAKPQKRILFIDDDPNILASLRRLLRNMRHEWDMAFARNAEEALEMFAEKPFDVMITDIRMPGMDGIELLKKVSQQYPETIRFVLSGQSETEAILRSIGLTHQYLSKPCDAENVKNAISRAFALRDLLAQDSLKELISKVKTLPSLPSLYVQVVNEIQSPDASLQKIAGMIEKDMGMSAKVLQLINSAFFGLPEKVTSPSQAVCLLGLNILKSLICMYKIFQDFNNLSFPGFSLEALWNHSANVASSAQQICARERPMDKELAKDAFMAGLFHDLGKLVLLANLPEQYKKAIEISRDTDVTMIKAEREVFGATHAEIGAYLLGLWGFSDPVIEASAFHHSPTQCLGRHFSTLTAVHVANVFEYETGTGASVLSSGNLDLEYIRELDLEDRVQTWREFCKPETRDDNEEN